MRNWRLTCDMTSIADTADFIPVYPEARADLTDGNSLNWVPKTPGTYDDITFLSALIETMTSDYQINQERIYACGMSLGGNYSFQAACRLNEKIAAIGVVARTMLTNPGSYCSPSHPTGVLTILGTNDFITPYNGQPGYYL